MSDAISRADERNEEIERARICEGLANAGPIEHTHRSHEERASEIHASELTLNDA